VEDRKMTRRKFQYADIGSISSGTMRNEDLIPVFTDELEYLAKVNHHKDHLELIKTIRLAMQTKDYYETEGAMYDLESLFDTLYEYALPYFYFGAHPGDGADYGYWLSEDMENSFDGLKVSDLSEIPTGYTGEVLYINDHGNLTLYNVVRGRCYEIWSVV
jgi:hypothetical protein